MTPKQIKTSIILTTISFIFAALGLMGNYFSNDPSNASLFFSCFVMAFISVMSFGYTIPNTIKAIKHNKTKGSNDNDR